MSDAPMTSLRESDKSSSPSYTVRALVVIAVLLAFVGIALLLHGPIPQPLAYHEFADDRAFFGIPNILDVLTNAPFLLAGIFGLVAFRKAYGAQAKYAWRLFFLSVVATSMGSAYYHWEPTNFSLFWDILPIACAASALSVAVLFDYAVRRFEHSMLIGFVTAGVGSVVYWKMVDDLRYYVIMQISPFLIILTLFLLTPTTFQDRPYFCYAILSYLAARISEIYDHEIFTLTGQMLSGHSLKHVLTAATVLVFALMLRRRCRRHSTL